MPESCSTVTYWAERSRLNWEKGLQARASRHRGTSRRLQPLKEGAMSPGRRAAGAAHCPGAGHRVRSPPCSASSLPGTGGQEGVQQANGHPPALLGARSAPLPHCCRPRGQSPSRAGEKHSPARRLGSSSLCSLLSCSQTSPPAQRERWALSTRAHGEATWSAASSLPGMRWATQGSKPEHALERVPHRLWEVQQARKSAEWQQGQQQKL